MNQDPEKQDEARENEAVEPAETTVEEEAREAEAVKDLENNPDIEDPRLYSPLLDSSAPALKERAAEERQGQAAEPETGEAEAEGEEEAEDEETASEKIDITNEEY